VFGYPALNGETRVRFPPGLPVVQWQNTKSERTNMFAAFLRGGRRDGALSCTQSEAGLTPALSTIVNQPLARGSPPRADG